MKITTTPIQDLVIAETNPYQDQRGSFYRAFCDRHLAPILETRIIRQMNVSCTKQVGAVRGLHFQYPPNAEMKLIRCLRGKVWDVAVDLRKDSPTFLKWHGVELSPENAYMMIIPEGFAHGFQVLEANSELLYLHTAAYFPQSEGGLKYDDIALNIFWPIPVTDISQRDASHPILSADFEGVVL